MAKRIIQVEEKVPFKLMLPLSIQHMFAMFGASVLVPFLFGINPAIVLLMNGIGTLLFILITKGKAPAYLGSSFAFIAPANIVIAQFGYEYALGGFVVVGFCGCLLAVLIKKFGTKWIDVVLPPAAMGPVVALIGLELSSSAASTAGLLDEVVDPNNVIVFGVTLGVAIIGSVCFKKFLSVIPILIAVICGYVAAVFCGMIDFTPVMEASFFALPNFAFPKFDINWLRDKLTELYGKDGYDLTVSSVNSTLSVNITSGMPNAVRLFYDFIWDVIPAHIALSAQQNVNTTIPVSIYTGACIASTSMSVIPSS